jgi:hypothetical protein
MLNKPFLAVSCLALLVTSGCVVTDGGPGPSYYGDLDVLLTINGTTDPGECAYYQIDSAYIAVYDSSDNFVAEAQPTCEEFGILFANLPYDSYFVDVQLFDINGGKKSEIQSNQVPVDRDLTEFYLDFPDASIY